jgi:hypothetical protein
MSESQPRLSALFVEAFRQLDRNRPTPAVDVRFYPYAGLHHTIRLRSGRVYVRISDIFRDAPLSVHRALAFILVARLLRRQPPECMIVFIVIMPAHRRFYARRILPAAGAAVK